MPVLRGTKFKNLGLNPAVPPGQRIIPILFNFALASQRLRNLRWISECERHFPAAESEGLCPNVRNRDDIYSVAALDVIFYDNAAVAGFRVPANGKLAPMVQKPSQSRPTERGAGNLVRLFEAPPI